MLHCHTIEGHDGCTDRCRNIRTRSDKVTVFQTAAARMALRDQSSGGSALVCVTFLPLIPPHETTYLEPSNTTLFRFSTEGWVLLTPRTLILRTVFKTVVSDCGPRTP